MQMCISRAICGELRTRGQSERVPKQLQGLGISIFSESQAPPQKGLTAWDVSVIGLARGSQKMTERKSTLAFVRHVFKLKRGPENLGSSQEANKVRQTAGRVGESPFGFGPSWQLIVSLQQALHSNSYPLMKERIIQEI